LALRSVHEQVTANDRIVYPGIAVPPDEWVASDAEAFVSGVDIHAATSRGRMAVAEQASSPR
jgi:hypothetical protein